MRRLAMTAALLLCGAILAVAPPAAADQNESAALPVAASSIAAGTAHTCVLLASGDVRCWGEGAYGQLGHGSTADIADGTGPSITAAGNVPLGGKATALTAGSNHTCALLTTSAVRCWGSGSDGQLGYDGVDNVGDGVGPSITAAGNVPLGGKATAVAAGRYHTCALLTTGAVRCWGDGYWGQLGHDSTDNVGDGTGLSIIAAGDVPLGGKAVAIAAGDDHTCAVLTGGSVRCWGSGTSGRLGHNSTDSIGNGVGPTIVAAGDVPIGGRAVALAVGGAHTCAVLATGAVRCWGYGANGRLGYNGVSDVGNAPASSIAAAGDVPLGGKAAAITAGDQHTCALLASGAVRCWGDSGYGRLGHGNLDAIGNGTGPTIVAAGNVPLGASAAAVTTGGGHTCALLASGTVRCWGYGGDGQLGYGDSDSRGGTPATTPDKLPAVPVGAAVRTRAKAGVTAKKPPRDKQAPYAFKVKGSLDGAFPRTAGTCAGKVKLTLRYGKKKLAAKKVGLSADCRFKGTVKASGKTLDKALPAQLVAQPGRPVKLTITVTFPGNANLTSARTVVKAKAR